MGFWSGSKKAAKFTFVSVPMAVLGVRSLRMNQQYINDLWRSLTLPHCPHCDRGILTPQRVDGSAPDHEEVPDAYVAWRCGQCGFGFYASPNKKRVRAYALQLRTQRYKEALSRVDRAQMQERFVQHQRNARIYYGASALLGLGFLYMIGSGSSLLLAFNWLAIAAALFVLGLTKAYRAWQVKTGTLFVPGAFWGWLRSGKWWA
jgi:hypothetical protein